MIRRRWHSVALAAAAFLLTPLPAPAQHAETRPANPVPSYTHLARRVLPPSPDEPLIPRKQAEQDLDQLERILETQFSYLGRRGVDHRAALDAIRAGLGDGIPRAELALQLGKLIALFGDGHASVEQMERLLPEGHAPFLTTLVGHRLVAFRQDRSGLLDEAFPYVRAIDGVPIDRWIEAAALTAAAGSPAVVAHDTRRRLRDLAYLRCELGLPHAPITTVELESEDSARSRTLQLELAPSRPTFGTWPRPSPAGPTHPPAELTADLPPDIGYLRIADMTGAEAEAEAAAIEATLRGYSGKSGIIIDLRGNGGGSRLLVSRLVPLFLRPQDSPWIVNVSAAKLRDNQDPDRAEGYLQDRSLHPLASPVWTEAQRTALAPSLAAFRPEWTPGPGTFSTWHVMALWPHEPDLAGPLAGIPTAILIDGGCFSATDILVAALDGLPSVTIVGTPTSGGSGRARSERLAHSRLTVRLSSMVSFRRDGRLYDGAGIEPHITVEPVPADLVAGPDRTLAAAVDHLRRPAEPKP